MSKRSKLDKFKFRQTDTQGKAVAIYVRVSSDEYAKNEEGEKERRASVQTQLEDAISRAKKNGWENHVIYDEDCNISGAENAINRPAITRLIADIQAGKIHSVIFRELSRFCRNEFLWKWFEYEIFLKYGVKPISLTEDIRIETSEGRMITGIKANQAQNYIIEQSEKAQRAKIWKAEKGTLRTSPCYGYGIREIDKVRGCYVKPDEAKVIIEIFERVAKGEGKQSILRDLLKRHIRSRDGGILTPRSINDYVRNRKYKGVCVYGGKEYKSPYPAIITDADLWQKANDAIDARFVKKGYRNRGHASNSHLLTGLVKCGYCYGKIQKGVKSDVKLYENLAVLVGRTWKDGVRVRYPVYRCQTKFKHGSASCPDSITMGLDYLEGEIKRMAGYYIDTIYSKHMSQDTTLADINRKIDACKGRIEMMKAKKQEALSDYSSDNSQLTKSDLTDIIRLTTSNLQKHTSELAQLEDERIRIGGMISGDNLKAWQVWDTLTMDQKKDGLRKIFDRILIYKNSISIVFRNGSLLGLPIRFVTTGKSHARRIDFSDLDIVNKAGV